MSIEEESRFPYQPGEEYDSKDQEVTLTPEQEEAVKKMLVEDKTLSASEARALVLAQEKGEE